MIKILTFCRVIIINVEEACKEMSQSCALVRTSFRAVW